MKAIIVVLLVISMFGAAVYEKHLDNADKMMKVTKGSVDKSSWSDKNWVRSPMSCRITAPCQITCENLDLTREDGIQTLYDGLEDAYKVSFNIVVL